MKKSSSGAGALKNVWTSGETSHRERRKRSLRLSLGIESPVDSTVEAKFCKN